MTESSPPPTVFLSDLRLETAHALVTQAGARGGVLPGDSPTRYLQAVIDGLCELSLRDPLTGLANRRHFHAVLEREIDRVARTGESALLLMLDIDHFKKINDTYGHTAGDTVLRLVAEALQHCVRPMDTLARYGGEEFAIVLPSCQASFAPLIAERLRLAVESACIQVSPSLALSVTISVGGAFAPRWIRSIAQLWIDRADHQLYQAKSAGRNRVSIEDPPHSTVSAEEKNMLFGHSSASSHENCLATVSDKSSMNPKDTAL